MFDWFAVGSGCFLLGCVFGFPGKVLILCLVACAIWHFCRLDAVLVVSGWVM